MKSALKSTTAVLAIIGGLALATTVAEARGKQGGATHTRAEHAAGSHSASGNGGHSKHHDKADAGTDDNGTDVGTDDNGTDVGEAPETETEIEGGGATYY